MSKSPDAYAVLGVTPAATPAEISHAFRAKLRALHPDTGNPGSLPTVDAAAQLRQLLEAYDLLRRRDHGRADTDLPRPRNPAPKPQAAAKIPVTYRRTPAPAIRKYLWAGPVRRHR